MKAKSFLPIFLFSASLSANPTQSSNIGMSANVMPIQANIKINDPDIERLKIVYKNWMEFAEDLDKRRKSVISEYEKAAVESTLIVMAPLVNKMAAVLKDPKTNEIKQSIDELIENLPLVEIYADECKRGFEITKLLIAHKKNSQDVMDRLNAVAADSRKWRNVQLENLKLKTAFSGNLEILKSLDTGIKNHLNPKQ